MQAVAAAGGEADLLLPHLLMQARVVRENDGRRTVRLLDRDGLERLSPADESTAPMSLDERVAELKRDPRFAAAFRASGASGSGAASGPSMPHTTPDTGRMTPVELLRLARRIS
jgi:hypothetical protein